MHTYDISLTLAPDLPVWPGDPPVVLQRISDMRAGDPNNVTQMQLCVHAGTHVDAPSHFLGDGVPSVEQLPLHLLTGRAYVLHLPDEVTLIDAAILERAEIPPRTRRLLFRTRNSALWARQEKQFQTDFVALSADGARHLVERGVRLVGVDYLSVAPYHESVPTHKILLEAGVVILEGLNLSQVSQGRYTLYCLPLKIAGSDGAPARAILVGV
jgi:arylformamidase